MAKVSKKVVSDPEDEKLRTFTGWKLDLCRAVRADHKVTVAAASLFAAIIDHVNKETKKAWPSEVMLALALGTSVPSVRKYMRILIDAKWLRRCDEKSPRGTTVYEIIDYRMNAVLDQFAIDLDRLREKQAERRTARRAAYRTKNVLKHGFKPKVPVSLNTGLERGLNTGLSEHLQATPSDIYSSEEENTYGRASNGY